MKRRASGPACARHADEGSSGGLIGWWFISFVCEISEEFVRA